MMALFFVIIVTLKNYVQIVFLPLLFLGGRILRPALFFEVPN
jgi:hypothetical protein